MKRLRVLWSTMKLQIKQSCVRPMFRFCLLVNPVIDTVLLYMMYKDSGEENYFAYVILGSGLMSLWGCICFSSAGDINRERWSGTLALIFTSPAKFSQIVLGKILGNTLVSLLTFVISFVTAVVFFGIHVSVANPLLFILTMAAAISSFVVISLSIAYLLTLSRKTELYMNCIELPFILLCGFVFPVDILPAWLQAVSRLLPPTYAVELLRETVFGVEDLAAYWSEFGLLIGLTFVYIILSAVLYKAIDRHVRIKGTLNVA